MGGDLGHCSCRICSSLDRSYCTVTGNEEEADNPRTEAMADWETSSAQATSPQATSPQATSPQATSPQATSTQATSTQATSTQATLSQASSVAFLNSTSGSLSTGGSTRPKNGRSPQRPPSPDFSHLTDDEKQRIVKVLGKQQQDELRNLRYIRSDLRDLALSNSLAGVYTSQEQNFCLSCTQAIIRSCSKWAASKSVCHHSCQLRRRHRLLSGMWYDNDDDVTNNLSGVNTLSSYLLLKATSARRHDPQHRPQTISQLPHTQPTTTDETISPQLPHTQPQVPHTHPDTTDNPSPSCCHGDNTSIPPAGDNVSYERRGSDSSPDLRCLRLKHRGSLDSMSGSPWSPWSSVDSGVASMDVTATSSILKKMSSGQLPRVNSPLSSLKRRVSFSKSLEQVQTFHPAEAIATQFVEIVDNITSRSSEEEKDEKVAEEVLETHVMSRASNSRTSPSRRPESRLNERQGVDDVTNTYMAGGDYVRLNNGRDKLKVGELGVVLQRSRLLDGISIQVKITRGRGFITHNTSAVSGATHGNMLVSEAAAPHDRRKQDTPTSSSSNIALSAEKSSKKSTSATQVSFVVKCHLLNPEQRGQKGRTLRSTSKHSFKSSLVSQQPLFNDQFAIVMREDELASFSCLRISILERQQVGILRRSLTTVYGTVELAITGLHNGVVAAAMHDVVRTIDQPEDRSAVTAETGAEDITAPDATVAMTSSQSPASQTSTATMAIDRYRSNAREHFRNSPSLAPLLHAWSTEDVSSPSPTATSIPRFASF